jgi:hypothetical protein
MNPVNIHTLIPGYKYFVRHYTNALKPRIITFNRIINLESTHAEFEYEHSKSKTTLREDEWLFYQCAQRVIARRVAINLADELCEDVVGIIERFVVGNKLPGSGPDRYSLYNPV